MAFKVDIDGSDRTSFIMRNPSPRVTLKQNERSTASLTLAPGLLPDLYDEIFLYDIDGTTKVFGGVVSQRTTQCFDQGSEEHLTELQCIDFMIYNDWVYWTKTYASTATLKTVLTDYIADKLAAYGVSLDPAQDDGDTLTLSPIVIVKGADLLRSLGTACDPPRVAVMSPDKKLRMLIPGTDSAPFNISDATPNCQSFEWTDSSFKPANKVTLICGPTGPGTPTQSWVSDGSTATWEVDIQAVPGGATAGGVFEDGVTFRTVSGPGGGGYYEWDDTDGRGTLSLGTGSVPSASVVLTFVYTASYPFEVSAASGATPVIEEVLTDVNQVSRPAAELEVAGALAKLNQTPREATVITLDGRCSPSESMNVTLTDRSVSSAVFTISQIEKEFTEFEDEGDEIWVVTMSMTETTVYQGSYLDQARQMFGVSSSVSKITSGGGSTPPPVVVMSSPYPMGGSTAQALPSATATVYSDIPNGNTFVAKADGTIFVRAWIWTAHAESSPGVPIVGRVRVYDNTASMQVDESGTVNSTDRWTGLVGFSIPVIAGHEYIVQGKTDTAGNPPKVMAQFEAV